MAGFIELFNKFTKPYVHYIFILSMVLLFTYAGYYGYSKYKEQFEGRFSDVANANQNNGVATIFMFHVNWCPHCKKAMPEWEKFIEKYDSKEINGYKIKCVDIDCTKESSDITSAIQKYNIESYPTIKMLRGEEVIEFDSKITDNTLGQFVETMLNQ